MFSLWSTQWWEIVIYKIYSYNRKLLPLVFLEKCYFSEYCITKIIQQIMLKSRARELRNIEYHGNWYFCISELNIVEVSNSRRITGRTGSKWLKKRKLKKCIKAWNLKIPLSIVWKVICPKFKCPRRDLIVWRTPMCGNKGIKVHNLMRIIKTWFWKKTFQKCTRKWFKILNLKKNWIR